MIWRNTCGLVDIKYLGGGGVSYADLFLEEIF